jgi:SAM-dependent methyltransferase
MSLSAEYERQRAWRAWPTVFAALPPLGGRTVLDVGCGVGDQAAVLAERGACVVGFDLNDDLLGVARARLPEAEFRCVDLRAHQDLGVAADGIWSSFAPAYFPDLASALKRWARTLRPGGFVALTEIDDLFGHEPVSPRTKELLAGYAADALTAGRYDFHMGRKVPGHLEAAGLSVVRTFTVPDQELSFDGPATPDVLDAWRRRLDHMKLLQETCGPEFPRLREELLGCLASPDHRSLATVHCCLAVKEGAAA